MAQQLQRPQRSPLHPGIVKAYEEKYGELPNNYAAEGYDAVWLLARGIKEANSADRVAIREASPRLPLKASTAHKAPSASRTTTSVSRA